MFICTENIWKAMAMNITFQVRGLSKGLSPSPFVYRILGKYGLTTILLRYLSGASFPSSKCWKKTVKTAIYEHEHFELKNRLIIDMSLGQFAAVHSEYVPCYLWQFSRLYRDQTKYCYTVINLVSKLFSHTYVIACTKCEINTDSIAVHNVMFCTYSSNIRHYMWCNLHKSLGSAAYDSLCHMCPRDQLIELITAFPSLNLTDKERVHSFKTAIRFLYYICR